MYNIQYLCEMKNYRLMESLCVLLEQKEYDRHYAQYHSLQKMVILLQERYKWFHRSPTLKLRSFFLCSVTSRILTSAWCKDKKKKSRIQVWFQTKSTSNTSLTSNKNLTVNMTIHYNLKNNLYSASSKAQNILEKRNNHKG